MIYSKKIKANHEWKKAFENYESLCGLEPMGQDDVDSGEMTIREAWNQNIRWIEHVAGDCSNISTPFDEEGL